jgi:multiple sugar transport system substrate-binding protein
VDMFAKAIQGMPAQDAIKWATSELKKVYEV